MSWLYLDDHFGEDPRLLRIGADGAWMHTQAMSYCARLLTDGQISEPVARVFSPRWKSLAAKLEAEGLWQRIDGGWTLPSFLEWNKTRAQVEEGRRERSEAGRKGGLARSKSEANASADASMFASESDQAKPNPVPSPVPRTQSKKLASPSLREVLRERLAKAFERLGCSDDALMERLLTDDARIVMVEKVELLAANPATSRGDPTSRIRNYLKACEDKIAAERARVRGSTQDTSPEAIRHEYKRQAGDLPCSSHCPICEPDECTGHMG